MMSDLTIAAFYDEMDKIAARDRREVRGARGAPAPGSVVGVTPVRPEPGKPATGEPKMTPRVPRAALKPKYRKADPKAYWASPPPNPIGPQKRKRG